jgi:hypothetical protein
VAQETSVKAEFFFEVDLVTKRKEEKLNWRFRQSETEGPLDYEVGISLMRQVRSAFEDKEYPHNVFQQYLIWRDENEMIRVLIETIDSLDAIA